MITRRNLVKRFRKYRLQYRWNAVCKSQGACRVGGHSRDEAQPRRSSSNGVANPNVWPCVDDDDTPRRAVVRGRSAPARQIARGRSRHPGRVKGRTADDRAQVRAVSQPFARRGRRQREPQASRATSSTPHLSRNQTAPSCYLCDPRRPTAPEVPLSDARAD